MESITRLNAATTMSLENKPLHNGHHHHPSNNVKPSQESRIAPRSTLANLLSSQRRSAVQSGIHRIQSARPFAGTAQIENAAKRAAAQLFPQPSQEKNRQGVSDSNIHKSSYNVSIQKPSTSSSPEPSSRRVTFVNHADPIPRKRARLEETVLQIMESASSAAQQFCKDKSTKLNAISPNISILRNVDPQKFIMKGAPLFKASTQDNSIDNYSPQIKLNDGSDRGNEVQSKRNNDPAIPIEHPVRRIEQSSKVTINHHRHITANVQNETLRRKVDDQFTGSQHKSVSKENKQVCTVHTTKISQPKLSHTSLKQIETTSEVPQKEKTKKKKKKHFSPFRTKVGCVVAVRFRKLTDGGNPNVVWVAEDGASFQPSGGVSDTKGKHEIAKIISREDDANSDRAQGHTSAAADAGSKQGSKRKPKQDEVWSTPIPGKDDGISLLGSWIRCFLPQHTTEENRNPATKPPSRALEGNVISIRDNDRNESGIRVVILVNRKDIESHSALLLLADNLDDDTTSPSERKTRELEARIRGKDKLAVQVTLASIIDQRRGSKLEPGIITQWAVRKRMSTKPVLKGNGGDTQFDNDTNRLVGEVVKVDASPTTKGSNTIATVTVKRLWTPEQTDGGRKAHHGPRELFDCWSDSGNAMFFQAPIEDLIVVGRGINRLVDAWNHSFLDSTLNDDSGQKFIVTHSYSDGDNSFIPLCSGDIKKDALEICHGCERSYHDSHLRRCQHHNSKNMIRPHWCTRCIELRGLSLPSVDETTWDGPCCTEKCDCQLCTAALGNTSADTKNLSLYGKETAKDKQQELKSSKIRKKHNKRALSEAKSKSTKKLKVGLDAEFGEDQIGKKNFGTKKCSRTVSFNRLPKRNWGLSKVKHASFLRERHPPRAIKIGKAEESSAPSGRAARANQRRIIKSLTALGDASKSIDRLAGRDREHVLRFDKSKVHGWGVYAEEQINAGDLIIEYRGEIIGNAVADKREKEYEKAKLDDYMFRIDAYTVCDATLLGNVARYINASCSPNCYTQIITAGENKRIVIFAKRDIQRGEELYYDYKFSLEYDPAKRIPCHCGSANCRGFMNWNKKYA